MANPKEFSMTTTLAFDIYGTLIDTNGVLRALQQTVGEKAAELSRLWRDKQVEYSFRRGLMQNYQTFAVCVSQSLDYACAYHQVSLSSAQKQALLEVYRKLPAFTDVPESLAALTAAGYRLFAFSNGSAEAVETLLVTAGIRDFFLGVVSTDELRSFKPNPAVYSHFLRAAGASGSSAWLVSSNPFDVIGAISAGMKAAWIKRSQTQIFDPWGIEPTLTVSSLPELSAQIAGYLPKS
ncbi:MAG: haloacid dehalogenase type II [Pseudomonadales bacterium]|nr:haloacid dehalogenase type II [Pseudomonadales bacterium]